MNQREQIEKLIARAYALGQLWVECPERREETSVRFAALKAEALELVPEWRPIESAPRDGTVVRLWVPDLNTQGDGKWLGGVWAIAGQEHFAWPRPSHWHPQLPKPPGNEEEPPA